VTSPSGVISYGNNIKGDELNNNERVVVATPELGEYTVQVMGKLFAAGACTSGSGYCQKVAVVAVSSGQIKYVSTSNINSNSYANNEARQNCSAADGNLVYVGMPSYGIGYWGNSYLTISSSSTSFTTTVSPATVRWFCFVINVTNCATFIRKRYQLDMKTNGLQQLLLCACPTAITH
jgi:hypothetical protein